MPEYINSSRCHMKFINDDEQIKKDFGYNRLNMRHKQCVRCRTKKHNMEIITLNMLGQCEKIL